MNNLTNYYLVGGSVRDTLMARIHGVAAPPGDKDWVVVGGTPKIMLAENFRSVGKDFPVFLHPETHEEYALARKERRSGFSPDVTLEDDLARRDLTINAMAMDGDRIIDPYGGSDDIQARVLRHVGSSFADDPLRILRVARFYARFDNFSIAPETLSLMSDMVAGGALQELTVERVWGETVKALGCRYPSRYFEALDACGALAVIFPELAALKGVPQTAIHHPEIDTFVHTMMVVDQAARLDGSLAVMTAALLHDLGKALSPVASLPRHIGHESAGIPLVRRVCNRLRVPGRVKALALLVTQYHLQCHCLLEMRSKKIVDLLSSIGAFKIEGRVEDFITACEADARGRKGFENRRYPQRHFLMRAFEVANEVQGEYFIKQGYEPGPRLGDLIRQERIRRVNAIQRAGS